MKKTTTYISIFLFYRTYSYVGSKYFPVMLLESWSTFKEIEDDSLYKQ